MPVRMADPKEKKDYRATETFLGIYTVYCEAIIGHKWRSSENQK